MKVDEPALEDEGEEEAEVVLVAKAGGEGDVCSLIKSFIASFSNMNTGNRSWTLTCGDPLSR